MENKPTFTIQTGFVTRESLAILAKATDLGLTYTFRDEPIPGTTPIGSVEFCSQIIPRDDDGEIDFFPSQLYWNMVNRYHYFAEVGSSSQYPLPRESYVKDISGWKTEWETKLYPKRTELTPGRTYFISDAVKMVNEWRYYVANGEIITTGWYRGQDEDKPAPELSLPEGFMFNGTVDIAELEDGSLELIECHAPFACGWYGEDHIDYVYWQYFAWNNYIK